MTTGITGVKPTTRAGEVMFTLLRFGLNGVAVVDIEDRLLGIVTLSDLRRRLMPSQAELAEHEDYLHRPELMEERFAEVALLPVSNLMVKKVLTVSPEENVLQAAALMNARHIKQMPVVEDGRVIGLISPRDIAWGLLALRRSL